MNTKLLRAVVGAIALSAAALVPVTFLGGSSIAAGPACQRVVWINPQTSVREAAGTMTLTVHTDGVCLVPGGVRVTVTPGSAAPADYWLPSGELHWGDGDASNRTLTAVITNDSAAHAPIEDFQVALAAIGADTRVAGAIGQGRILDDDTLSLLAAVDDAACLRSDTGTGSSIPSTIYTQLTGNILLSSVVFNRPSLAGLALIVHTSNGTMLGGANYVPVNQLVPVSEGCPVTRPGPCALGPTSITVNVRLLAARRRSAHRGPHAAADSRRAHGSTPVALAGAGPEQPGRRWPHRPRPRRRGLPDRVRGDRADPSPGGSHLFSVVDSQTRGFSTCCRSGTSCGSDGWRRRPGAFGRD